MGWEASLGCECLLEYKMKVVGVEDEIEVKQMNKCLLG